MIHAERDPSLCRPFTKEVFIRYCRFTLRLEPLSALLAIAGWAATHFQNTGDFLLLAYTIGFSRAVLEVCPANHPARAPTMTVLGRWLGTWYSATRERVHLHEGIRLQLDAIHLATTNPADIPQEIYDLARFLVSRFEETGQLDYLEEAIGARRESVAASEDKSMRVRALLTLANDLHMRFQRRSDIDIADLNESISICEEALNVCMNDSSLTQAPHELETSFALRSLHDGHAAAEPDEDIRIQREASTLPGEDDETLRQSLNDLATVLHARFDIQGVKTDLDRCISLRKRSLVACGGTGSLRGKILHNLANGIFRRFQQYGDIADLHDALSLHRESQPYFLSTDEGHAVSLHNLAMVLATRYRQLESEDDLEESIQLYRKLLRLCKEGHPDRASVLHAMAAVLSMRFSWKSTWDDLREAAILLQEAIDLRPVGNPYRSDSLGNMAAIVIQRSIGEKKPEDLETAIRLNREALTLRGRDHPDRSNSLNGLGVAIRARFDCAGDIKDLEEVVDLHREALLFRPPGHPLRLDSLNNLSASLIERFRRLGNSEDADESLALREDALKHLGSGQPDYVRVLFALVELYMEKNTPFHDLEVALQHLLDAIQDNTVHAAQRLTTATELLAIIRTTDVRHTERLRPKYLSVLLAVVDLLPMVITRYFDIRFRLEGLLLEVDVTTDAASLALIMNQPQVAVEVLEAGRALFWTRSLNLRPQLDSLPPSLGEELRELSGQVEAGSWKPLLGFDLPGPGETLSKAAIEQEFGKRRRQGAAFDSLIARIRAVPGCERFWYPDTFDKLVHAAEKGPVVVLVSGEDSCDAIILTTARGAQRIPLPQVSADKLQRMCAILKTSNASSRERVGEDARKLNKRQPDHPDTPHVLGILWKDVVKIVLDALELKRSTGLVRPRLWWCPTGHFAFLPVHAAGVNARDGECCSDYVVSSYTPTLSALLTARRNLRAVERRAVKVLLAAVPVPYRGGLLPATVDEISDVKRIIPPELVIPLPAEDDCMIDRFAGATIGTLLEKLPDATILHLASHGWQHPSDPLESGFMMRDGMLTISKLMPIPLPNAFMAFLSACETAKGDQTQPDQTIHLAATVLFAGFKSVVATMWSMSDIDGPEVAKTVYERLLSGTGEHLDPEVIPYALDAAVQDLRAKGVHPSRWAPYIHIGV